MPEDLPDHLLAATSLLDDAGHPHLGCDHSLDERDRVSPEARTQAGEAGRLQRRAVYGTGSTVTAGSHAADISNTELRQVARDWHSEDTNARVETTLIWVI